MTKMISARLSDVARKELEAYMQRFNLNITDALESLCLGAKNIKKPEEQPDRYHAEVSENTPDMVKCPIGKNKGLWVRQSVCRKCEETQCDIKR